MRGTVAPARREPTFRFGWLAMVVLASLIGLASLRYLYAGPDASPPPLRQNLFDHPLAFYVHIAASTVALLVGPWQFIDSLRQRHRQLHRVLGGVYGASCGVGGGAALLIAPTNAGGLLGAIGFSALAVLWIGTTIAAIVAILQGDVGRHRRWMVRSFALALSAVTLRLYLPLVFVAPIPFAAAYGLVAWLCWLPNLVVAEFILRPRP